MDALNDGSISRLEFSHFIHETGMFNVSSDEKILSKIFASCTSATLDGRSSTALRRPQFLEACFRASIVYHKLNADDELTTSMAVAKGVEDFIEPAVNRLTTGSFRSISHSEASARTHLYLMPTGHCGFVSGVLCKDAQIL